jgi:ribonucleoside-diphosphate reductase alpha chain
MKIKKIVRTNEKKPTWDLEVKSKHNYLMKNGCVSHNSTALYIGKYPSIESMYSNLYTKDNMLGKFLMINNYLIQDLQELGLYSKELIDKIKKANGDIQSIKEIPDDLKYLYRGAFEVNPMAQVEHAGVMTRWIDQSHSRNIFVKDASGKLLNEIYMTLWKLGVKTSYYLRTKAVSSSEKST